METIKLGIIGAGFVAHFQARAIRQIRNVEIAGITSRTKARAEALARIVRDDGIGAGVVYDSVGEMAPHVDAIAIFSPNFTRIEIMEQIVAAVKQGAALKGAICEKPLGRNVAEARGLVELADEANLRTAYFENQIFMKPVRAQLAQLAPQQKTMGPLVLTRSAEEHGGPHEPWFWDPTRQGGGVLSDMGCHSIAVGWYVLTPPGKAPTFLEPVSVSADCALLKWGLPAWREKLLHNTGVDYGKTPAEDFATGMVTYRNPETGQLVKAQFTDSWMFEKQGLRLFMDGMGPGYAFEVNTLRSTLELFIGDVAAEAIANAEMALEKATASRGLLAVQYNEADLYGYTDENEDAASAFLAGRDGFLSWRYGLEITKLVMAAYLSAERQQTVDLMDPAVQQELESYVPLIQQGRGGEVLLNIT
ncbi:MAG: Gfo/Idh/MocA family oxidoreductase [Chloroflexi bacterium]|nr:Gfo/Idh/MocA family oxidoreductase [Chloroflexota bacterium]MCI0579603.1 Gfo/Idh/MocA family oxidoreductase [Chloroflexota bacterium]MCI0644836.1 Gfo/Idh/MocA family oxidoreductase [Chloroflexota bacterium]MCI0731438.1 Gfo/Idh/MocA family oxidoreductase [Chloroflexota bacterium]